jgi:phage terminase small subunit
MAGAKVGKSSRNGANSLSKESVRMVMFIAEYPKDLNATKAAERAGYKWPEKIGPRLLKHPAIKAAIGTQVKEKMEIAGLTVDRTLEEVRRLAFFDPIGIFEDDGTVRQMKDISAEARACIAGVEVVELFDGTGDQRNCYGLLKKIKFHDKNSSLDKSMRYHSLYRDRVQVDIDVDGIADSLARARKRAALQGRPER